MIVKDAMVVIHLAKLTLLKGSCECFKPVVIPEAVQAEIRAGREKGYPDAQLVEELIRARALKVQRVKDRQFLKRAAEFNLQGGEAEAVALYWQEGADYLASDDDNVRKKSLLLNINLVGTPAIILKLFKDKIISKDKCVQSIAALRKIGWFSNAAIDQLLREIA